MYTARSVTYVDTYWNCCTVKCLDWLKLVVSLLQKRNIYKTWIQKTKSFRLIRHGWESNIKTDLREEWKTCVELDSSGTEQRCAACVCEYKSDIYIYIYIYIYIFKEPTWCNLAVCLLVTAIILYMFRKLLASILRST